ncbi:GntP family permease [Actinotignum sp. GS-2025c]|uniref:GntP family permease n=1 Tax=Actinotignum sp. GS-2025c TaxID=3427276 RepID=UPI003F47D0D6
MTPLLAMPLGTLPAVFPIEAETASAHPGVLVAAALLGIATIVVLITVCKVHPFLSLMFGSVVMALVAGVPLLDVFDSFTKGLGSTVGSVGVLIVLGSMIGALLIKSGGADTIVDSIIGRTSTSKLPWAMALIAFIIGIPLFFEVGVVLLIPVVLMVARKSHVNVLLIGVPALAGLVCLHGFVPPHPGPLIAIDALGANLGLTLGIGLIIAIPAVIIGGPLVAPMMARAIPDLQPKELISTDEPVPAEHRPGFFASIMIVLLPVILMMLRSVVEMTGLNVPVLTTALLFLGEPVVALLSSVIYGAFALGMRGGRGLQGVSDIIGSSLPPIAGILLIVGAGGGFKQTLVDSGIADVIGNWLSGLPLSPLLAAWLVAVFIRLATGSATVATITAAGLVAHLAEGMEPISLALMVLAIGAGSLFMSHVNDAGFWLVKEYFGMTVGQTFKTWSALTTIISIVGIVMVEIIHLFV